MRYIIYCRKSSESEDRQVMSLDAQEKELLKLAERDGLKVIGTLRESMSAKAPGRPIFAQMVTKFAEHKADGILCWKLDRLARNPVDGGSISWLLQQSNIKCIKTIDREYLPTDNVLMMSVEFGMSNQYVRDLSENVKRGNREKLRRGEWPNHAPYGYINDKVSKKVIVDTNKAPWIIRMYELYASGTKSYRDISNILYQAGFRADSGGKIFQSVIQRVITSRFYHGIMEREGVQYQGKHEPIISKSLYNQAQQVATQASRPKSHTLMFALRGPLRCKVCDCMLTAATKKGHRYYYCTNGKGSCDQHRSYMSEKYITEKLANEMDALQFDEELVDIMYQAARQRLGMHTDTAHEQVANIKRELSLVEERESRLTDLAASGTLRNDLYKTKMRDLNNQRVGLQFQLGQLQGKTASDEGTLERTKKIFLQANRAKKEFLEAKDERKREITNTLLWNAWFQDKEIVELRYKEPYSIIAKTPKNADFGTLLRDLDSNQDTILQRDVSYH